MTGPLASVVADVAAAILSGRVLHVTSAEEDDGIPRNWGIVDLSEAGPLDVLLNGIKSRAWHSDIHGVPHRWTREDAEKRARGFTGSSPFGAVHEALELPAGPTRASVGPFAVVGQAPGSCFRCIDWTDGAGAVVEPTHAVPHINLEDGLSHTYEDDPSAFGAALAFVRLVGERAAYEALASATEAA